MEDDVKSLGEYLTILKRRRWQFIVPAIALFVAAFALAVVLPSVYQSTATILIEQQEVPPELVRTTVTSYAAERVQVISYRVMTTDKLGEIIERFNLYPEKRAQKTLGAVAQEMRDDVALEMVSAEVLDPRSGRKGEATIAFQLSYTNPDPQLAQKVLSELTTLFLNENLRSRRAAAQDTSEFLAAQGEKLAGEISRLESQLAEFKEQNAENLPERMQLNLQLLQRTEDQLRTNETAMRTLEERLIFLEAGLAQLDPYVATGATTGGRVLSAAERLKALEVQYAGIAARYSNTHPDRVQMEKEMAALRRAVAGTNTSELQRTLREQKAELAALRERYSAEHPDVKKLQRAIAATEQQISTKRDTATGGGVIEADNPAYIQMQAQLQAADAELNSLRGERQQLEQKRTDLERRLTGAPAIERDYRALTRDYDNAVASYRETQVKMMSAELAENLESESKGERFSLIEPPQVPEKPYKPNRLAILFLGFVFSLGGGLGHVALRENLDTTVKGAAGVIRITGAPPLATIPFIATEQELAEQRQRRVWLAVGIGGGIIAAVLAIHFFFRPLDVLWFSLLSRLDLLLQGTAG